MPASPALTRLSSGHYNTGDWNATTNQGGMGGDGHRQALVPPKPPQTGNYPVLTSDIAAVAAELAGAAGDAADSAALAVASAAAVADLQTRLFIQATDPGPVGAGKVWAATDGLLRVRSADNSTWSVIVLPSLATDLAAGLVRLATPTQAFDGAASDLAVTPAGLSPFIRAALSAPYHQGAI